MIPDFEIPKCPEFEVKSKIGKIFKKHNPFEEYSVKIYEIDRYFYEHYKKIQIDKNECKYTLLKIDIYSSEQKNRKKHQKKNLVVNLLELIQIMQKMVMIQIMRLVTQKHLLMSLKTDNQKKKNQKKKSNKKIKELEAKIKEL